LQRVGVGGYYRIIEIQSFIEDGKFETVLKTKWQASGLGIEQETDSLNVSADEPEHHEYKDNSDSGFDELRKNRQQVLGGPPQDIPPQHGLQPEQPAGYETFGNVEHLQFQQDNWVMDPNKPASTFSPLLPPGSVTQVVPPGPDGSQDQTKKSVHLINRNK